MFRETKLSGVFEINVLPAHDSRGFFARSWCQKEFEEHGLEPKLRQCNISFNIRKGTLRGMHYQIAPNAEAKLVRCTSGSIYDVVIDLRPDSPTYRSWVGAALSAEIRNMMYVPKGCAHGFVTLADNTEVCYQMSDFYSPEAARGIRWDDPTFKVAWPARVEVISERDRTYPDFEPIKCVY